MNNLKNVIEIPQRAAFNRKGAAAYLGISEHTLWRLASVGKIRHTSYGTYPKTELDRHLAAELEETRQ